MLRSVSYFLAVVAPLLETGLLIVRLGALVGSSVGVTVGALKAEHFEVTYFVTFSAFFALCLATRMSTLVLLGATTPAGPLRGLVVVLA